VDLDIGEREVRYSIGEESESERNGSREK